MLEQVSASPTQEKQVGKMENVSELPPHLDVAALMKEKNAFFVHMIQVTNQLNVSDNNESIDTSKLSVADKLDLVYGANPSLSASTLRPHTTDGTFYGGFGVIFSHGEVEHASASDAGTKAISLTKRAVVGGTDNTPEDVDRAIERPLGMSKSYNELVLKNPEVSGGFMKLDGFDGRITYENEETTYYDGETKVTKLGIIDFSKPLDRFGRPTGGSYDKPFSTLVEMSKRGKVFVMDEGNQMYIVSNIDEAKHTATFVASPITPSDYSYHYGAERMNKYNKKETADRLEQSLKEKGMTLDQSPLVH
jgi:hypothetical protein